MKKLFAALSVLLFATGALALDLAAARSSGALGEKRDGYVSVLKPGGGAEALAAEVNARRREEYQKISSQNGQPVDVVAKLAAPAIIAKLPAGASYQDDNGAWKKK